MRLVCAALVVLAWSTSASAADMTEQQFASAIVVPRCEAQWGAENASAAIALENSNPGGVVDLVALHQDGQVLQYWQAVIKKLDPAYVLRRHHAFHGWMTEPACIVDYDNEMAARGCSRVEDPSGKSHHWVCPGK